MKFVYTGRKMDVSEDLKVYSEKKFKKLDRFFTNDATAQLTFSIERGKHIVEATVKQGGLFFRAIEKSADMYSSIDGVVALIERQIRKNKTRLEKRLREGAFERQIPDEKPVYEDTAQYEVVRRKRFEMKPMTVEDAILQMNLLDHEFFFFKNADSGNVPCVVYKRDDGGYGLIESA